MFETIKKDWQDGKIISIEDVMFFSEQETLKRFEWLKKEIWNSKIQSGDVKIVLEDVEQQIDQAKTMNIEKLDSFSKSCEEIKDIMRELNGIKN